MMVVRPGPAFVFSHPAHIVAFGFGAGLAPVAPGTFGTLLGWALGWGLGALHPGTGVPHGDGVFRHRRVGLRGHRAPPRRRRPWRDGLGRGGRLPAHPRHRAARARRQAAAFGAFRFDVAKPPPIRYCERRYGGGFGVMFDDLVAAAYALLVLAALKGCSSDGCSCAKVGERLKAARAGS